MEFNKRIAVIALFILIVLFAANEAYGYDGAKISIGRTTVNSDAAFGEIGYEYRDFELNAGYIGHGETKYQHQKEAVKFYSLSHLIKPEWKIWSVENYYRLGVAYIDGSPLVGKSNYRLGVGLSYKHFSVEWFHFSSGGIHPRNTGIDGIQIKLNIPK